jgi:threonine/homoserine efflux transporter RhtA
MSRTLKSLLVFAGAGLLGPLAWKVERHPSRIESFISDLVFLLWPTQPMGVIETNVGAPRALALTIGANLVLFAVIGVIVGLVARSRGQLAVAYAVVCLLLFAWAFWGAGFSFAHLGILALAVALLVYAIPFWVVMRAAGCPILARSLRKGGNT